MSSSSGWLLLPLNSFIAVLSEAVAEAFSKMPNGDRRKKFREAFRPHQVRSSIASRARSFQARKEIRWTKPCHPARRSCSTSSVKRKLGRAQFPFQQYDEKWLNKIFVALEPGTRAAITVARRVRCSGCSFSRSLASKISRPSCRRFNGRSCRGWVSRPFGDSNR